MSRDPIGSNKNHPTVLPKVPTDQPEVATVGVSSFTGAAEGEMGARARRRTGQVWGECLVISRTPMEK